MDAKTRMHETQHSKADIDKAHLTRKEDMRGQILLECTYKTSTKGLEKYLANTKGQLLKQVYKYFISKELLSIHKEILKFAQELQLQTNDIEAEEAALISNIVRELKGTAMAQTISNFKARWKGKPLDEQYVNRSRKMTLTKRRLLNGCKTLD